MDNTSITINNFGIPMAMKHGEHVVLFRHGLQKNEIKKAYGKINTKDLCNGNPHFCSNSDFLDGCSCCDKMDYDYSWEKESQDIIIPEKYLKLYNQLITLLSS